MNLPEEIFVSPQTLEKMKEELEELMGPGREEMSTRLLRARELGDLKENAEYHAAKERQGFIEGRIRELEVKVGQAEVIEPPRDGDRITFGSTVKLRDPDGKEVRYQIVGSDEADPAAGRVSVLSPLVRTLIGKAVGDEVRVQTPGGLRTFEIVGANFPWS